MAQTNYISASRNGSEVLVWERGERGRELKRFPAPFNFYVADPNGEHKDLFGNNVRRKDFTTSSAFYEERNQHLSDGTRLYESDIPPEIKVLSEHYYDLPAPDLNVTFLDIEVDYDPDIGFASVSNPYAPINSISIHHMFEDKTVVYAVPPDDSWTSPDQLSGEMHQLAEIVFCRDEKTLLMYVIAEIEDSDLVSGWNSDFFDMPYIAKRIERVLGKQWFRRLSFEHGQPPKYREVEIYGNTQYTIDFDGRISCDYLALFQKYEMEERRSYKLESISEEMLPELPKLEYKGTLATLYQDDFEYFIRYNIRDTEILVGLENKLGYIALANGMYHMSTGLFKHVGGTIKLHDLAVMNYCHYELNCVVPDIKEPEESAKIQGAYVLEPEVGLHEGIGSIDISSLYPSSIRSLNISPEMIIGQFTDKEHACDLIANQSDEIIELVFENGRYKEMSAKEWRDYLRQQGWAISGFGTVFDQNINGIFPSILKMWFDMRKEHKKNMKNAYKQAIEYPEDSEQYKHFMDLHDYYDRLQYVFKIKLNSFYGALSNQYFRFYDLRMGESTTATGRNILRHQCAATNELMKGIYDPSGESIIYGDTDSSYFKLDFKSNQPDKMVEQADSAVEEVNKTFQPFMQSRFLCQDGFDDIITAEREIVSDRGIFVDKKRYILHVINDEGKQVDKPKVMGLDTKKTTLPKHTAEKVNEFVERFLKGESWDKIAQEIVDYKDQLRNSENVFDVGLPKGVGDMQHYTKQYQLYGDDARLPGHFAAAIYYNQCLEQYEDKESLPIMSSMKVRIFYLLGKNHGRFKSIALPTDIDKVPDWFIQNFNIDYDAHIKRLVDAPLNNIIKAVGLESPTKQSLFTDSLLEF